MRRPAGAALAWALAALPCSAATISIQVDPPEPSAGETMQVLITVQGAVPGLVKLPGVDGLAVMPEVKTTRTSSFSTGGFTLVGGKIFEVVAQRPGDFIIPAFDVPLEGGGTARTQDLKFHVSGGGEPAAVPSPTTALSDPGATAATNSPGTSAMILPPADAGLTGAPGTGNTPTAGVGASAVLAVPRDKDGGPAKVFILITPETTDAYVGQLVPLRIVFYIRMEVYADQNSLPTLRGSDFLMNNFSVRGHTGLVGIEGEQYECDTWLTAISSPKSGDFPLVAERDTYWVKSVTSSGMDPFGFSRHPNLAHEVIASNQDTIHVRPLPEEGRPEHFTGAIGQFDVTADARPTSVNTGEPVALDFSIAGEGNFDYVRCPVLAADPNWKVYTPSTRITFRDEARTNAVKVFEQSLIARTTGTVPLPAATFSYFNPSLKQYVTVPLPLPAIAVAGPDSSLSAAPAAPASAEAVPIPQDSNQLLPNFAAIGAVQKTLAPSYRQAWFWVVQGLAAALPLLAMLGAIVRRRAASDPRTTDRAARRNTALQDEAAMAQAVKEKNDAAFFIAARHRVQLQLGERWDVRPESITLSEVRRRDPELAERLQPLFTQADEVIYSGRASANVDLEHWNRLVAAFLEDQTAPA